MMNPTLFDHLVPGQRIATRLAASIVRRLNAGKIVLHAEYVFACACAEHELARAGFVAVDRDMAQALSDDGDFVDAPAQSRPH